MGALIYMDTVQRHTVGHTHIHIPKMLDPSLLISTGNGFSTLRALFMLCPFRSFCLHFHASHFIVQTKWKQEVDDTGKYAK